VKPRRAPVIATALAMVVVAVGALVITGSSRTGAINRPTVVAWRPVLCEVPAFVAPSTSTGPRATGAPRCSSRSLWNRANLGVVPNANLVSGFTYRVVPHDDGLGGVVTTPPNRDTATATVVVPVYGERSARYVLGPDDLVAGCVRSAQAQRNQAGQWVVNVALSTKGATLWDHVAARQFHEVEALVYEGTAVSAPLIQPTQTSFTSFDGQMSIAGSFTRALATQIAAALRAS